MKTGICASLRSPAPRTSSAAVSPSWRRPVADAVNPGVVHIRVNGRPAPQGSKRHVGNGRMIEMSKAVGPWREAVRAETQAAVTAPLDGAVGVSVLFWLPRPRSHYRTGRHADVVKPTAPRRPTGRPDLDKLARAVLD